MPFWLINVQSLFFWVCLNQDSSLQCLLRGVVLCGSSSWRLNNTPVSETETEWCEQHRSSVNRLFIFCVTSFCSLAKSWLLETWKRPVVTSSHCVCLLPLSFVHLEQMWGLSALEQLLESKCRCRLFNITVYPDNWNKKNIWLNPVWLRSKMSCSSFTVLCLQVIP